MVNTATCAMVKNKGTIVESLEYTGRHHGMERHGRRQLHRHRRHGQKQRATVTAMQQSTKQWRGMEEAA
jgi:hypothetical protein